MYLDERIALFIIALHSKDRVPRRTSTDLHLCHLIVEKVGEILFVDLWSDASNVQAPRLTRQVRVHCHTHAKRGHRHWRRKAGNCQNRRDLRAIRAREVEEP